MTGREALRALADGKRLRWAAWEKPERPEDGYIEWSDELGVVWGNGKRYDLALAGHHWQVVESPATDEELIAEMERLRAEWVERRDLSAADSYAYCARMLRERKVTP